ncbi:MAG: DUF3644 domain-containing protein [Candidatus Hodarchaeota archaeon]
MQRLSRVVREHLEKARASALSAVENYNKPGIGFRTRTYIILMVTAWAALLHAIFYRKKRKPWYIVKGSGRGTRYTKVDGEPKHWELGECLKQYYRDQNPPERKNLEFMLRLRNKIEHRNHPELDPALYGECQSMLMNFEDLLVKEFGHQYALAETLAVSLQFSALRQKEQEKALKKLERSAARDVLDFIQKFRAGLPPEVLESSKFSLKVFLVPKLANRESAADLAVEFVPYDPSKPEEMKDLRRITAMIKEKRIPIASKGLMKPSEVVERLKECLPFRVTMHTHTRAWKYYKARPKSGSINPEKTKSEFCVYDYLMEGYGYTEAWVRFLCRRLQDPNEYRKVAGLEPGLI